MTLKSKLISVLALIGVISCSSVYATEITSVFSGETISRDALKNIATTNEFDTNVISKTLWITSSNYKTNNGEIYWKVVDTSESGNSEDLYCLNLSKGFGAPNGSVYSSGGNLEDSDGNEIATREYRTRYNLNTMTESDYQNYTGLSTAVKNKVLWILNNSLTSKEDIRTILTAASEKVEKAGWTEYVKNDMKENNDTRTALTFEDIKIVQQIAIWHYTNPGSVFENSIVGICDSNGNQISGQGDKDIHVVTETFDNYMRKGEIKQAKLNALYSYFIEGAEKGSTTGELPSLNLTKTNATIVESGENYLVGPFSLVATNNELIKNITANINVDYTLLNSSKEAIANNDFSKVIGKDFYLKIQKSKITNTTDIQINLTGVYNKKTITLYTNANDPIGTQPVVLIEDKEENISTSTNISIELLNVLVEKVWADADNADGIRPNKITVELYEISNGQEVAIERKELNESNNWKYTWNGLLDGEYTVKELNNLNIPVENGKQYNQYYTVSYKIEDNKVIITNTHKQETIEINGTKTWDDNNNQDGIRPNSITINLLANGKEVKETVINTNTNSTFKFTNLPKYENGKEIEYRITEDYVEGYTTTIDNYNITNKHIPETTQKTVTKVWEDGNDTDKIRPDEITVELYKINNGQEETVETRKLDSSNNWTYTWNKLPKKSDGKVIVYGVKEITSIEGYETEYTAKDYSQVDTITITNTHVSKNLAIQIQKVDSQGNIITSSEAKFEIEGAQNLTSETNEGIFDLNAQKLVGLDFAFDYTINETLAPAGYNGLTEEISVKIAGTTKVENGSYVINNINITDKDGNDLDNTKVLAEYNEDLNKVVLKIINNKIENGYSVKLLKVGEDGTTAIEGAYFKINNGEAILISKDGKEIATGTLKNDGELNLTYKLEETIAPEGYIKIDGQKEVKINAKVELKDIEYQITEVKLTEEIEGITVAEENNVITIKVENKILVNGNYNVVLRKVDENGDKLIGSKFKVSGTEYDLSTGEVIVYENQQISSEDSIDLTYIIEETLVPAGYNGIEITEVNIKAKVEKKDNNYKLTKADLVDGEGKNINNENISIKLEGESIVVEVKNTPIEKKFDLALRKFITSVNDVKYSREPIVDTSTISSTGTATYKHIKQPIAVQKGDIVTYTIRVYNEGELDGYVDMITDFIPNNLIPIIVGNEAIDQEKYADEIEFNLNWGWITSEDGKSVTTTKTSKVNSEIYSEEDSDTKLEAYVEGSDKLDYIDVQIKCLVADSAVSGEFLTNIAEITKMCDVNGIEVETDRDSTKANAETNNINNYKNDEAINSTTDSYVKGQEDDDDFGKLVVKEFDLALRKFIVKVNETNYSREPIVDTSKLGTIVNGKNITTAIYNHSKNPVIVETNDVVTYTIRIYNEGTLNGFANEITDNIPKGLEFIPNSDINLSYNWKMLDKEGKQTEDIKKAVMITTEYLSDDTKSNVIEARTEIDGVKKLNYKDVQVQFKVVAEPENLKDNIIINEAQISEDTDRDIDSAPNRNEKYDYTTGNNEDDIDYEPIKLQYFDLALRKFVTKVNEVNYNNRYPEVIYNEDGSITYKQTKEPVLITTGDTIIYTIRVYNEGEKAGYATEIKDNLPEGLAFDPNNELNKKYGWKMLDSDGNVTDKAEKVVAFSTEYLKEQIITPLVKENGSKLLSYKDVQIAFIVTETELSDKILVNIAQISKDSDDDIDSNPNNNVESEDDTDKEYVRVQYFDLSLKKWVKEVKVTVDGKTTTTKTNYKEDSDSIAKVDIIASKLKKTTVKFVYNIKVTNEGELPGYAYEIKDYIPNGLKFVAEDNKDWKKLKDGAVVTDKLKDTLLNPGESATVEIVLTWKISSTNLGLKTNYAEISSDSANDIDSIPDNFDFTEDDIDEAQVILSIKTAGATTYIGLIFTTVAILALGVFLIKKYVLN